MGTARRRRTAGLAGLLAALAASSGAAEALAEAPAKPPRPLIVAEDGSSARAAQGSYCWTQPDGEGSAAGICADTGDPIEFAPTLRVSPGSLLSIRMRYPVRTLSASDGAAGERLELRPVGEGGRRFHLRLARGATPRVDLSLFARYDRGDAAFALKLRPERGR